MGDEAPPPPPEEGGEGGAEEAEAEQGLTEMDILEHFAGKYAEKDEDGNLIPRFELEAGLDGMKGFFMNTENFHKYGLVLEKEENDDVLFSGRNSMPYKVFSKAEQQEEVKKVGFYSDFHPHMKDIDKFKGPELLLLKDKERVYGDNFVWANTVESMAREMAKIEELREQIIAEQTKSAGGGGGGGEGGEGGGEVGEDGVAVVEEDVVVRDLPKECKEWVSETMDATHEEVKVFSVANSRPFLQVMLSRKRNQFGAPVKFNDAAENLHTCRPQKDPNFALQRKELELGVQAVRESRESSCQTTWFRPVNASVQYDPKDFLRDDDQGWDQVDQLTVFLTSVSVAVEEALQQNETVDIFKEEFANLGEEEMGFGSKAHSNIKELRNFHDVTYTRSKRIEWVEWVPGSTTVLAVSCCENCPFHERLDQAGKAGTSTILLWSFHDSLAPHGVLLSPWEVSTFKFCPSDRQFLVGGLSSGQMIIWKLSDSDLGYTVREKKESQNEEEKGATITQITHRLVSMIDESHKRPVLAIEWLPGGLEVERRGRTVEKGTPEDSPSKYLLTAAGDGQVLIWNFLEAKESLNDHDFLWRPVHRVQLQRQDSGTEMGLCHLLYATGIFIEEKDAKKKAEGERKKALTNFYASTEEGELIFGDWAAKQEEDRKPEFCKKMLTVSKTFRPMLSLERSPFFPDVILGVTDWAFFIWKEGIDEHLFQSCGTSALSYYTRGTWSPTRPSLIFLGRMDGALDLWDFSDQSHKASLSHPLASVAISSMVFLQNRDPNAQQMLAVGDEHGHLHVLNLPKNLVKPQGKELNAMQKFLQREEQRVEYFTKRREVLHDLKEKMEKDEQNAAQEDETANQGKEAEDEEKEDTKAEAEYKKLELEIMANLGLLGQK